MYYYFENKKPIKSTVKVPGADLIDKDGNGWFDCNWNEFVKPNLVYNDGWQVVETATPEEMIEIKKQKEFEANMEFARQKKADGQQFYEEIDARQVAMMKGKTSAEIDALDVEYKRKILPYIEVVNGGQWWTAKRLMNNTTLPKIDIVKDLFIEVRQRIRDYVTNNYPTNGTNN